MRILARVLASAAALAAFAPPALAQSAATDPAATTVAPAAMPDPAAPGAMQFVRREQVQPVAASADPAALASGELPVCKPNQQDGCINSYAKTGKGNRPLNYWPGKPASEIPGPKPQG